MSQQQAIDIANNYINLTPLSKVGLIEQLKYEDSVMK